LISPFFDSFEYLPVGQQPAHFFHIAGLDELCLPQAAFTLGGFFGQYMAAMRFGKSIFSATGFPEAFGG
jgi:hypothetical protein